MSDREPLTERATLYCVSVKVRPLPGHPRFWDSQCGMLNVWLFADDAFAAKERADEIIKLLPYERVGTQSAVSDNEEYDEADPVEKEFARRKGLAKESGLSLLLIAVATGADETGFENAVLK